jgi:outer membrane protein TolC
VKNLKRLIPIALVPALVAPGCTAQHYKRSADRQVNRILNDRTKTTLGYTPQIEAEASVPQRPAKQAYDKIPASPIPPELPPVIERAELELPYERLGPEDLFGEDASPQHALLGEEAARQPAMERLRLGPPTSVPTASVFDLFQAIDYGVEHSRDYQTRMEDLFLAALDVTLERHLFSPRPFAETGVQYTGGQRDVDFRSALAVTNSVGVRQQLPYGGEVVAQALVDFVNALSDTAESGESAQLILSGTIPLLRGAGAVNLEPLIQAERDLVYEVRRFEDFRRSFAVQVATQYFRLLALQSAIANRRFNYVVLENLTEQTQALYGAGRINFLNVQRALQSQLSAENSLIDAEDAYSAALDNFKVLIGMPIEQDLEVTAVQLDVNVPDLEADAPELALKYRLDLQTQRDRIEDAQRDVQVARNGLLPDLDLTARGSLRNEDDEPARQIENDSAQYSVALNMDWPVDRLRERNVYRRALIGLERAQRSFVEVRDDIIADVRDAVRNIRSAQATLQIQQRAVDLAQRRLEYSNELLVQGRATDSRDVVEAQQSLLQAQDQFDRARAELQIQVLNFLRDTGILRVDPDAGALGMALNRDGVDPVPAPPPTN